MREEIRLVDLVIEIIDARLPQGSRNPDLDDLAASKFRLMVFNKLDLSDENVCSRWMDYYREKGSACIGLDARNNSEVKRIKSICADICRERIERDRSRGIKNRPVRAMVAGIPNVGKSTFINSLAGKAGAKTGNKPGVTKGSQWIKVDKQFELLDTPGVLWPKFEDQLVARNLAVIGSINDDILSMEELGAYLIDHLNKFYPGVLEARYGGSDIEAVASKIGAVKKGSETDYLRAYNALIDDFRSAKLGRICLEVFKDE